MGAREPSSRAFQSIARVARAVRRRLRPTELERQLDRWHAADGERTHRLQYDLKEHAVVLDIGGYKGQWSHDIFALYRPTIHVFEPVAEFAEGIRQRFLNNNKVTVHEVGLASGDQTATIYLNDYASSMFLDAGLGHETITLLKASEWLRGRGIDAVDLMKIHTEGAEYDLLEHLLGEGWVPRIRDIQVQFHDCAPRAAERLARIRERLAATHELTYSFPLLWENWHRR